MKRWSVLRITTEEFVIEAETEEEACNKVRPMQRFIHTIDVEAEEVAPDEELSFP